MKLCGYKEKCFVNGDKYWGHLGYCMCLHLGEKKNNSICNLTKEKVNYYDK